MDVQEDRKRSRSGAPDDAPAGVSMGRDAAALWFSSFPEAAAVIGSDRRIIFLNEKAEGLLGISGGDSSPYSEILRSDGCSIDLIERCLSEGESSKEQPLFLVGAQRERRLFSATTAPVRNAAGHVIGCTVILREVPPQPPFPFAFPNDPVTLFNVLENFPAAFFTVDRDLVVTYMNRQLEILTGYNRAETVNRRTCSDILNTAECNSTDCVLRQALQQNVGIADSRRTILNRAGEKIPVVVCAYTMTDSQNRVIGAFETVRDISRYVEAERKLEFVTEISQEGLMLMDADFNVLFGNSRMAEILKVSKEELMGMDARTIIARQQQALISDLMRRADEEKPGNLRFCTTIEPIEGTPLDYRAFETCIAAAKIGRSVFACICFRDITNRVRIERRLSDTNSFLNNIIRSSVDGIIVVDTKGKVLIFNEGAENILGFKAEEMIENREALRKICDPDVARENMRKMRSSEYGPPGKLNNTRLTFYNKEREPLPVNFSAAIIKDGEQEVGSVGIFTDLREHLRIRQELEEARNQLVQSEKISSLGRLAAGVAHEINNPLSGILIFADMLLKDVGDNPQWREDLQEIINQTLRCKQIVTRLLEFSRQSLGRKVLYMLNDAIAQCIELLSHQTLFHDIEIVQDLQPDLPQLTGDPSQLQQVFTNLFINAADALQGKGRIAISTRYDDVEQAVTIYVSDSGPGIPQEIKNKIFEPFFTTKKPGEGTGLGLPVVHGIVQRHGGAIEVHNAPEGGAVFVITLPLAPPEPPEVQGVM